MRVRTYLRVRRTQLGLSIADVACLARLSKGEVSMFERGHSVPRDDQVAAMEAVYGPPSGWYPAGVGAVLMPDLDDCPGCGDELDPDASRTRRYHSDQCRSEARRAGTRTATVA